MRVVFMGTPAFAATILDDLAEQHDVAAVYTRPDAVRGRGKRLEPSPVKAAAERRGLRVLTPRTLRDEAAQRELASFAPDVICVAAYGAILPKEVLDIPRFGCLNVHASLLPRWRGAAPIERAILAGDEEAGVCIMRMEEGLDTGAYCVCRTARIDGKTAPELTDEWVTENLSESRGWKTVDEMRSSIASDLERSMLSSYLQNKVVEESTVSEIPEELITYQEDSAIAEVQNYASMYGFKLEDMLSMLTGYATTDEYLAANEEAIENAAKSHLVFQAIAEDADVNVTDEDVQAYFKHNMGMDNIDSLEQSYGMPYLKLVTLIDKVNDLLQDTAVIEE